MGRQRGIYGGIVAVALGGLVGAILPVTGAGAAEPAVEAAEPAIEAPSDRGAEAPSLSVTRAVGDEIVTEVVEVPPTADADAVDRLATAFEADPAVVAVEETLHLSTQALSNDPLRRTSDRRPDVGGQWALDNVPFERTWETTGVNGAGIVVAVIDTGVDRNHPDLAGRVLPGADCTAATTYSSDPAAPTPCTTGWAASDPRGHGTHVAGVIAANANNGVGIAGAAPGVSILPVRALDASGTGSSIAIANAIKWAALQGADVINLSLGLCINIAPYSSPYCAAAGSSSASLAHATQFAVDHDAVVVAAVGNEGLLAGRATVLPAAYPDVVGVAAVDSLNQKASFSNAGSFVDLAAPGVEVRSTATTVIAPSCDDPSGYALCSGTSMAAPHVAAAAALVRAAAPAAAAPAVVSTLTAQAVPLGTTTSFGHGLVDPLAGVRAARGETPHPAPVITHLAKGSDPLSAGPIVVGRSERFELVLAGSGFTPVAGTFGVTSPSGAITASANGGIADALDERIRLTVTAVNAAVGLHDLSVTTAYGTATCSQCIEVRATTASTPAAPTATAVNPTTIQAAWSATPGATHYRVAFTASPQAARLQEVAVTAATSITIDSLRPTTSYTVRVAACDATGACSAASAAPAVSTPRALPAAPAAIWHWAVDDHAAEVDWFDVADADYFEVTRNGSFYGHRYEPWVTVTGLTAGTTYVIGVRSCNTAGCSAPVTTQFTTTGGWTPPPPPPPPAPVGSGYWMLSQDGGVFTFGDAAFYGSPGVRLSSAAGSGVTATDIEPTPSNRGYWILDSTGRVDNFGDAQFHGSLVGLPGGERAVSMSRTPSGHGYWVFTDRGRVFAYGDATHVGDLHGIPLNGPVVGSIATPSGQGYYMVASDGGIFTFGDAAFYGSMGGTPLNGPVVGLVPTPSNQGYWLVADDGGIFAFGDAWFRGSMGGAPLNQPVTGMLRFGDGYLMVAADGGIFTFSSLPFHGSLGGVPLGRPIVTAATTG